MGRMERRKIMNTDVEIETKCKVCQVSDVDSESGRQICNTCLGFDSPTEVEEVKVKAICKIHGEHEGMVLGRRYYADLCKRCVLEKRAKTKEENKHKRTDQKVEVEPPIKNAKQHVGMTMDKTSGIGVPNPIEHIGPIYGHPYPVPTEDATILTPQDFEPYPGLLNTLKQIALEDVRSPSQQIIFCLRLMYMTEKDNEGREKLA